jgi:CubicO group peptidase (beta-lactamase class C family)
VSEASDPVIGFLSAEIHGGAMPGAAWWIGDAQRVLSHGALGRATLIPLPEPASGGTPYDLASLTKPLVTALLAVALDAEGRFDLERELGAWFPALRGTAYAPATIRDALLHRARLPAWLPLYAAGADRDAFARTIAAAAPGPEGGTVYSDPGYMLVGFAIESAVGASLDRLFDERVAKPLALRRCGFPGTGATFSDAAATERGNAFERRLARESAARYGFRDGLIRGTVHDGNAWALGGVAGHAGLFGTAADVGALARALLEPERLGLPPQSLEPMWNVSAGGRTVGFLAAAEAEAVRGILPDDAVGHLGFTGTSLWIDRAQPRIFVLLTNRVHPAVPDAPFTGTRRGFHERARAL